jgi:HAD superfamily 5'-nucleotidase-like hydrolase
MEANTGAFQFTHFEWIGFDMDHTLVRYKNDNLLKLCYDCCINYLVQEKHYDACIRDELKFDPTFLIKGTIADKEKGNFVKLDHRRKVIRATHGVTPLTSEEIAQIYPEPLDFTGTTTERFWLCTSYFEMSFISAYAMLITWIDARIDASNGSTQLTKAQWYKKINRDVFRALIFNFGGAWDRGWYFPEIFREPTKYLEDCSGTRKWLTELRARGVKLFMVTNSDKKYADALMDHCFGIDWKCTLKEN